MITIYGKNNCSYCVRAKQVCEQHHLEYEYFSVDTAPQLQVEFRKLFPEAKTVPQIMWDGNYVGGYTELTIEIENLGIGNYGQGAF